MKENEAPEKIWLGKSTQNLMLFDPNSNTYVEYIRKDVFIEKACEWLADNARAFDEGDIYNAEDLVEYFRAYMGGE